MNYLLRSVTVLLLLIPAILSAQKTFEGIISYRVELTGANVDQYSAYMPEGYTYAFKGNWMKFSIVGGMTDDLMGDIVLDNKKGMGYMIRQKEAVAYEIGANGASTSQTPTITRMSEIISIMGYPCVKYKVEYESDEGSWLEYVWITDQIRVFQSQKHDNIPAEVGQIVIEGLEGFPLKIMKIVPEGEFIMVVTANQVEEKKLNKTDFEIPRSFEVKAFDERVFGGY